ncbi:Pimeloyl-ACP methyl ester carboxylesterase [Fodinibius sediminis]|uniref:Proline iminopeptidase n=2 Tax=Fodinibius sediminis TaxID=1214077 RepID=A0A521CPD7_9BACT|nr:Pimeloyl-ACP methyl ester carboxylesterase [Fodinibius sediminis]
MGKKIVGLAMPTGTFLVLLLIISSCRGTTQNIPGDGVAELLAIEIGGMQQWVLIRGANRNNPVLLWLHGGPGAAQMPIHDAFTSELEEEYIVVHWDQRGAGKSNHRGFAEETMEMAQFVLDVHEVTQYLKKRFDREKIYLLGHSWGTTLGIQAVYRYPGDYRAFISVAQVVHPQRADKISYQWLRNQVEKEGAKEDRRKLAELGLPPFEEHDRYVKFAKMKDAFGGGMDAPFFKLLWKSLGTAIYSFSDYIAWLKGASRGSGPMWNETREMNLFTEIDTLQIPVFFFTGVHDYNTPCVLVKEYYQFVQAPRGKVLISFRHSAHTPFIAETVRFNREVIRVKQQIERQQP